MSNDNLYKALEEYDMNKPIVTTIEFEDSDEEDITNTFILGHNVDNINSRNINECGGKDKGKLTTEEKKNSNPATQPENYYSNREATEASFSNKPTGKHYDNVMASLTDRKTYLKLLIQKISENLLKIIILSRSSTQYSKLKYRLYRYTYDSIMSFHNLSPYIKEICTKNILTRTHILTKEIGVTTNISDIKILLFDITEWAINENKKADSVTQRSEYSGYIHNDTVSANKTGNVCINTTPEISISYDPSLLKYSNRVNESQTISSQYNDQNYQIGNGTHIQPMHAKHRSNKRSRPYPEQLGNGFSPSHIVNPNMQAMPRPPNLKNCNAPATTVTAYNPPPPLRYEAFCQANQTYELPPYRKSPAPYPGSSFQTGNGIPPNLSTYNILIGSSPPILPQSKSPPYLGARFPQEQLMLSGGWADSPSDNHTLPSTFSNVQNLRSPVSKNNLQTNTIYPESELMKRLTCSTNLPTSINVGNICTICEENGKNGCSYKHLQLSNDRKLQRGK